MAYLVWCLLFVFLLPHVWTSSYIPQASNVFLSEAFFITIERDWFKTSFSYDDDLEFSASLVDMPDLPNWMFSRHPNSSQDAFLYGAAEEIGSLDIEIIALSRSSYKTSQKVLKLNVQPRDTIATFEVEMKFLNLNVEDMFKASRLDRLLELFRSSLWKESKVLYVTKVVSSLDVGGRLPLNPNEKEGVVVRIGGITSFSRTLQDLEREVQPLRNRFPCPRDYKRTSVEHLFRKRNFIADWCSFRLISSKKIGTTGSSHGWSSPAYSSISLSSEDFKPQSMHLPRRDFLFDFIVSIVVPSTVVGILSTVLTCIMCCNKGLENKFDEHTNLQLVQHNSIHCSTNPSEILTVERNSPPCSGSSVALSVRESPVPTLRKSTGTR